MNYLDFDLLIEKSATGYRAKVLNSPAGQASQEFSLPFSTLEVENFVLRLGHLRETTRRFESADMESAKEFGGKLFTALFASDLKNCWQSSLDAATRDQAGLRLRLRLSAAPELLNVPWEFLYHASSNSFLGLSAETPLVRYLDLPGRIVTLTVHPPLRALVMIASPRDYLKLDVEREWQHLKDAVAGLEQRGLLMLERLSVPTLGALQQQLRKQDYHIFHFIGHGAYDQRAQDGVLLLEDKMGQSAPISGQNLGIILHDKTTLRLALLNCCEGGKTSANDPFAGVCQTLVQKGIPAVIGMQFAITDQAAITLTHEFYTSLADGLPVDTALAEARRSIFAEHNNVEWGTPVLYMRTPDGQIFHVEPTSTPKPLQWWQQWHVLLVGLALLVGIAILGYELRSKPAPTKETTAASSQNRPSASDATAILTETPQPTDTATSVPAVTQPSLPANGTEHVYKFDNGRSDGWSLDPGWTIVPLETGGGALQVIAPQSNWTGTGLTTTHALASNIRLQVRFRLLQATNGSGGDADLKLSIRSNTAPSGPESYSVYISSSEQNIRLRRDDHTGYAAGAQLHDAPVAFVWQLNHWYTLSLTAQGSQISVWIDDKPMLSVTDTGLTNGDYYVSATPGTKIQFDEIRLATS